ncbi:AAA family ATPase [Streptomyces sp. NPDC056738]|uniref:helix-turn-helix transcriptional regulator n=1 Tax=Streptomyces sp. NPDC056738 TaxID=3345933 RepID=UPI0036979DA7
MVRVYPGPLRGRSEPVANAISAVRSAVHHGSSSLIMVSGPPGIGKTALLREVSSQTARMDVRVASGGCEPMDQVTPGAPVIAALRKGRSPLVDAEEYEQIVALSGQPLLLAERIAAVLESAVASGPVLVCLDDWQWADRVSRFITRMLLDRFFGLPVLWLFASRDEDALTDLAGSDPGSIEHIRLAPLTTADLVDIAQDRLGRLPDARTRSFLDAAAGSPLLATQLLDDLALAEVPGNQNTLSLRFNTAVAERLSQVSHDARTLVGLVAVAGRPVSPREALYMLSTADNAGVGDAVAEACASGLIEADGDSMATPHDLVRDAIVAAMPREDVRTFHRRLARYYFESKGDVLLAAAHASDAAMPGDVTSALILVTAAERLEDVSPDDAGDLAVRAFRILAREHEEWLAMGRRCLSVLRRTERTDDAINVADRILARIDDTNVAGEVESEAAQALWLGGRLGQLLTRVERVLANGPLAPTVEARLRSASALANSRLLSGQHAAKLAEAALEGARASADSEAIVLALRASGEAARNRALHREALKSFRELRTLRGSLHLSDEITELQFLDRYDHAQTLLDEARANSADRTTAILPALQCAQIWQDYNLGRSDEAEAGARTLLEFGRELGNNLYALDAIVVQTAVALLRGDTEVGATRFAAAERLAGADNEVCRPALMVMRGWLRVSQGDIAAATAAFGPLMSGDAKTCNYWPLWPCWMGLFFAVGSAAADQRFTDMVVQEAEIAAERNPGVASFEGLALNVRGRSTGDLSLIAESAQVLARSPRPLLRAFGAESYGEALLAIGDRSAGLAQLDSAWDNYDRIGAIKYRNKVQSVMSDAGTRRRAKWAAAAARPSSGWGALTEAERRVAALVASGHTNRSAAKELGVSVNTVGTHLRLVFSKLKIQSRVQLVNILHAEGRG